MKKLLLFLAIISATFIILSCSNNSNRGNRLVLSTWSSSQVETEAINMLIDAFRNKYPDIPIEIQTLVGEYNDALQTQLLSGGGPDIFWIDAYTINQYINLDVLEPLTDFNTEGFITNMLAPFYSDNTLYAVPKDFSTLALFYNKDMTEAAGITIRDNMTWQEFTNNAAKLTTSSVVGLGAVFELARLHYMLQSDGSTIEVNGNPNITNRNVYYILNELIKLRDNKYMITPTDAGKGWLGELFGAEMVAMAVEGPWSYSYLKESFPNLNFGIVQVPKNPNGSESTAAYTVGYGINKNSQNKEWAKTFIEFATSEEGMKIPTEKASLLPVRNSLFSLVSNPDLKPFTDSASKAVVWTGSKNMPYLFQEFANFIPTALEGQSSLEQALNNIQNSVENTIKNNP